MTKPEVREFAGIRLSGVCRRMSFSDDRTSEIWREFRSREKDLQHRVGGKSYSVKVYDAGYSFANLDPSAGFEKWAAAQVSERNEGFEMLDIPPGKYAVFVHRGSPADAPKTFGHIFGEWLPTSPFVLDLRPHFEVLPIGYSPFDTNAEEEIWIPIREK